MPTKPLKLQTQHSVPIEYSGKWVAWSSDHANIVAHGNSLNEVWRDAQKKHIVEPIFEKIPHEDARFVGAI